MARKVDCSFAEVFVHLIFFFGAGMYIGLSVSSFDLPGNSSSQMPVEVRKMIAQVEDAQNAVDKDIQHLGARVANNSNIIQNLASRFDFECVKLNEDFLQRMKNDKLVFFLKKPFTQKPKVLITLKSLSAYQPSTFGKYRLTQVVKPENVDLGSFKFSIEVLAKEAKSGELKLKEAEVCYVAFDDNVIRVA